MGAHGDSARSVDFINLPYIIVLSLGKLSLFSVSKIIFINIKQKIKNGLLVLLTLLVTLVR